MEEEDENEERIGIREEQVRSNKDASEVRD